MRHHLVAQTATYTTHNNIRGDHRVAADLRLGQHGHRDRPHPRRRTTNLSEQTLAICRGLTIGVWLVGDFTVL